jgi:predicted Ser/Thr protein kinase
MRKLEKINMKVNSFSSGEIEINELIGSGKFGQVYSGNWKGTKVALKLLTDFGSQTENMLHEFLSEISVLR